MSEYASAVERARRAFASVSRLEGALAHAPSRRDLQTNLAASQKLAHQAQEQLLRLSEIRHIEVCNYRLLPEATGGFSLPYVSQSLLDYQNLFSQIHDSLRNGPKQNALIGKEALEESSMEFAYSYSGSLGVVLFAQNERDFLGGKLDDAIKRFFEVVDIDSRQTVREIAYQLGRAVIKRLHDWSDVNIKGGFATDVRWNKSDGLHLGEVIERRRLENIVGYIDATSDEKIDEIWVNGALIGGNLKSRNFHFVVPNGPDFRGKLAKNFSQDTEMHLGKFYVAKIFRTETVNYATDKIEQKFELMQLSEPTIPVSDFAGG